MMGDKTKLKLNSRNTRVGQRYFKRVARAPLSI